MNVDGSEQTRLTHDGAMRNLIDWSPDGKKFAFYSRVISTIPYNIYVLDLTDFAYTRLTNNTQRHDVDPNWSPDGTKIAFASERAEPNNFDIYVMDADGSNIRRLTNHPSWSYNFV